MLIPNHPHDERLSALASGDPDAAADAALSAHVAECGRCTSVVGELRVLTATLAELPDLQPHRPLRLLPAVTDAAASPADRLGGWARRFFAPALTAGAALAMVGLVGTVAPVANTLQSGGAPAVQEELTDSGGDTGAAEDGDTFLAQTAAPAVAGEAASPSTDGAAYGAGEEPAGTSGRLALGDGDDDQRALSADTDVPAERSPWPMVLFSGVAVMVAAALLRWILVPRAG